MEEIFEYINYRAPKIWYLLQEIINIAILNKKSRTRYFVPQHCLYKLCKIGIPGVGFL